MNASTANANSNSLTVDYSAPNFILSGGVLTISGDQDSANQSDTIRLIRDPNNPGDLLVFVNNPPQHANGDFCLDSSVVRYAAEHVGPTYTYAGTGVFSPAFFAGVPPDAIMKLRPLLDAGIAKGIVSGEHHAGRWVDVGTPERLTELDCELWQTRRQTI